MADPLYTLLFEGLWVLADRAGRLENRPLRIKAELFPYREGLDMNAMLSWLEQNGFIRRYSSNGLALIQVVEFAKHQNPHKNEPESIYPPPDEIGSSTEKIGSTHADSGFLIPDSGLRIPAAPASPAAPPPPAKRPKKAEKTSMPEGFGVSERVRKWADGKGFGQLQEHLEAFIRKARARGYTYVDWDDAFMEAIREDWAKLRGKTANGSAPAPEIRIHETAEETARKLAESQRGAKPPTLETLQKLAELRRAA